jgi:thioredoxin
MSYRDINDKELDEAINLDPVVVIYFWAPWCGPCVSTVPIFREVSEAMASQAHFLKLDISQNPEASERLGVRGIPYMVIFSRGQKRAEILGRTTTSKLQDIITQVIELPPD